MNNNEIELIKELKNGNFENVELDYWFINQDIDYILATIKGCEKNIDINLLKLIVMYANKLLIKPNLVVEARNVEKFAKKRYNKDLTALWPFGNNTGTEYIEYANEYEKEVKDNSIEILYKVIDICSKHKKYSGTVKSLKSCSDEDIRLYYCANVDYESFLNDTNPRIRKCAAILLATDIKMRHLSSYDDEYQQIIFLKNALEKKAINYCEGELTGEYEDKASVLFDSLMFEYSCEIENFDIDILYSINDKTTLARQINELIKKGMIQLDKDMIPDYFKREGFQKTIKKY